MTYASYRSPETRTLHLQHKGFRTSAARFIIMLSAALIALLLCMGLMPHTAFADDGFVDDTTLTTTSDKTAYQAGDTATIQVTITNNTPKPLDEATIDATLPSQMSLVSGSLSHDAAGLAAGASKTFTFTAKIAGGGLAKTSDNGGFIAIAVLTFGVVCAAVVLLLARKKKFIGPFAALTVVACAFLALPTAAYGGAIGDFYENSHAVTINGQSAAINFEVKTTYEGDPSGLLIEDGVVKKVLKFEEKVKIPKIYDGDFVTEIATGVFRECDKAVCEDPKEGCNCEECKEGVCNCERKTAVLIPDTITKIGDYAFENCLELTSAAIPDSVITIGDGAFKKCRSLTSVNIPGSIESFGDFIFESCSALTDVNIDESCTTISKGLFKDCPALANVTIPSSVTTIEEQAFLGTGLTTLHIPDAVEEIGTKAFQGCASLKSVTFGANPQITTLKDSLFAGCAALEDFIIPSSVTTIGEYVFMGTKLDSIVIPDTVGQIGGSAFAGCTLLGTVSFGEDPQITAIAGYTFSGCTNLSTICIPSKVTLIGDGAFQNCTSLTSIDIPDSVTKIGKDAFNGCSSLAQVNFGVESKLLQIEQFAFAECASLQSFTVPSSLTSMLPNAFKDCAQLSEVVFQGVIPGEGEPFEDDIFGNTPMLTVLYYTAEAVSKDERWETYRLNPGKVFGKDIALKS